jgi:hypothetical protein
MENIEGIFYKFEIENSRAKEVLEEILMVRSFYFIIFGKNLKRS